MAVKRMRFARHSLCSCGFPIQEEAKLGQAYFIDPDVSYKATVKCGGCKRHYRVNMVPVISQQSPQIFLPLEALRDAD